MSNTVNPLWKIASGIEKMGSSDSPEPNKEISNYKNRLVELYHEGGIKEVFRGIRDFVRMELHTDYAETRVDNDTRWSFISEYLPSDAETLIDIGCAEGEMTRLAGESGLGAVGYDNNYNRLQSARKKSASSGTV